MSNKSSVEQFAIALYEGGYLQGNGDEIDKLLNTFQEIEKEQAQRTFKESRLTNSFVGFKHKTFEEYYNETYGGNK
jgi:rubrerythrin